MAEELGLEQLRGSVLNTIGVARVHLGDLDGVRDLERCIEILEAARSSEAFRGYGNLGAIMSDLGDLGRGLELIDKAIEVAERFGHAGGARFHRGNRPGGLFEMGEWDQALEEAEHFLVEVEAGSPHLQETPVRLVRARIRVARDDIAGALADTKTGLERARAAGEPHVLYGVLVYAAWVFLEAEERGDAALMGAELVGADVPPGYLAELAIVLTELGRPADARSAVERAPLETLWLDTARAYLGGDFVRAADLFAEIGHLPDEAYVRLRAAERFVADGRRKEADSQLQRSLAFWRSVGATRYIREAEALLAATA